MRFRNRRHMLVMVIAACSAVERHTDRGGESPDSSGGSSRATTSPGLPVPPPIWPISDSFPLQIPGEREYPVVLLRSEGTELCGGRIVFTIRRRAVLYTDTLRMNPEEGCDEPFLGDFKEVIYDLRSLHATTTWTDLENVVPPEARPRYGSPPYIFIYRNGWESTRAIAWNPQTRTFDVLVPGGMW